MDTLQLVANYSSEQSQSVSSVGGARTLSSSAEGVGDASEELLELIEALETDAKLSSIEASALAKMVMVVFFINGMVSRKVLLSSGTSGG